MLFYRHFLTQLQANHWCRLLSQDITVGFKHKNQPATLVWLLHVGTDVISVLCGLASCARCICVDRSWDYVGYLSAIGELLSFQSCLHMVVLVVHITVTLFSGTLLDMRDSIIWQEFTTNMRESHTITTEKCVLICTCVLHYILSLFSLIYPFPFLSPSLPSFSCIVLQLSLCLTCKGKVTPDGRVAVYTKNIVYLMNMESITCLKWMTCDFTGMFLTIVIVM